MQRFIVVTENGNYLFVHKILLENAKKKKHPARAAKCLKDNDYKAFILHENELVYLSLDIICSSKFAGFLEIRSVRILKQIMSDDKYPCIFSRQVEAIVSILLRYN